MHKLKHLNLDCQLSGISFRVWLLFFRSTWLEKKIIWQSFLWVCLWCFLRSYFLSSSGTLSIFRISSKKKKTHSNITVTRRLPERVPRLQQRKSQTEIDSRTAFADSQNKESQVWLSVQQRENYIDYNKQRCKKYLQKISWLNYTFTAI